MRRKYWPNCPFRFIQSSTFITLEMKGFLSGEVIYLILLEGEIHYPPFTFLIIGQQDLLQLEPGEGKLVLLLDLQLVGPPLKLKLVDFFFHSTSAVTFSSAVVKAAIYAFSLCLCQCPPLSESKGSKYRSATGERTQSQSGPRGCKEAR